MDITSIKKFLKPTKPQPADFVRFHQLLLQGVALHAFEGDPDDLTRFRDEIAFAAGRLSEDSSSEQWLVDVGIVVHTLAEYNRLTAKFATSNTKELQAMLAMMTDTIACLSASNQTEVENLQVIEKSIEKAAALEDLHALRTKLSDCLTAVRNETVRVRETAQSQIESLRAAVGGVANVSVNVEAAAGVPAGAAAEDTDPETGLPGRAEAERLIAGKMAAGSNFAIALFVVDRLGPINARFGRRVGDEILVMVAQHLAQQSPEASLLRWSGPAFVLVLRIEPEFSAVERHIREIASVRVEKNIDTDGRLLMLPISFSWALERVTPRDSAPAVFRKLDGFIAARTGSAGYGQQGRTGRP